MQKAVLSAMFVVAAVAALAVSLSTAPVTAADMRPAQMTPVPAGPGFCTAHVNVFRWGHMYWRTSAGVVLPTLAMCYEPNCPAAC